MQSMPSPAKLQSQYKKQDKVKFNQVSMNDDQKCQSTAYSDKNCQETQSINMWPMKLSMEMQLPKPAVPYKYTMLYSDKNCQSAGFMW